MMPSPTDLTYFLEAASTRNLSRAAERLGISQPSLSLAIQRLEGNLGVAVLIRSKRGVTLTQAGRQLVQHSRELLQRWEAVKGGALASVREVRGRYTIGCHPSVAGYSLPLFLPELLETHTGLEVRLVHDLSRKITEAVVQMEIDVGIAVNPGRHPDLVISKLCDDEVTFWAGRGRSSVQDFKAGTAVLVCDPELLQAQSLLKKLKKGGIRYGRIVPSSSLEVITKLVASGAGIGIIPGRVAAAAEEKGLRRIPDAPVFRDEVCVLYRVENRGVKAVQEIVRSVVRAFQLR